MRLSSVLEGMGLFCMTDALKDIGTLEVVVFDAASAPVVTEKLERRSFLVKQIFPLLLVRYVICCDFYRQRYLLFWN